MGLRVNTNVGSINAQRHLYNTSTKLNSSLEKLSSGLRINRAADDAAGLAISEALKSDIRALEQASRNAADGISLVQTAEGALDEVSSILLRMRELAEQAATETLGSAERAYLGQEYDDLAAEITRISVTTEFNSVQLLGGVGTLDIQVGIGVTADSQVSIDLNATMGAADLLLDVESLTGTDNTNPLSAITAIENATQTVSALRASFGAVQNRLETSIRNTGMAVENLSAANSRIRDVDIAAETAHMTSLQILQQAGVSILSQANMTPQMSLMLLQG